ncbi:MAG: ATP-dependent helicase [Lachnospiraceae bacterium]|nr:ATP-dependent helicase [Lachnospiraceae bacterium]
MLPENELLYGSGLSSLSPSQLKAVTHFRGPCEVIAGPGSGKTMVITYRLQQLISAHLIDPSNILTLTFTRAAASEMAGRASKLMGDRASAVTFGTFHSVFLKILRHTYRFTSDNIIDTRKQKELLKEITESMKIELRDRNRTLSGLINEISRVKCSSGPGESFDSAYIDGTLFHELFDRYKKRMKDLKLIDFDDMMLLSLDLFKERPETLKKWQDKFKFIQVDEFQDLDRVQYELIKLLSGEDRNLFTVGDDDQSIYGFRGADPRVMMSFREDHPEAELIFLSENFRSDPEIVGAAGKVISANQFRIDKNIIPGRELSREPSGEDTAVDLRGFKDREEEITAFKEISDRHSLKNAAILLRTNELLSYYAEKLSILNISFNCRDRIKNIYDHFIAVDIFAILALSNGDRSRSLFLTVMNRPFRGISRNALPFEKVSMEDILRFHEKDLRTIAEVRRFFRDLSLLSKMKPFAAVHYILKGMGYERFLKNLAQEKGLDLEELLRTAEEIKQRAASFRSFAAWKEKAEDYSRELQRMDSKRGNSKEGAGLELMTMHAGKGLEFDEVFLFDVNEGIIPYHKAVLPMEIEEERRLLYTAMTRARNRLHIWHIRDNTGKKTEPSRFII